MSGVALPSAFSAGAWANETSIQVAETREYFFRSNKKTLREMLRYYSRVTGIQYFYSEPDIGLINVDRIEGHLAIGDALKRTLRGTGYEYRFTDANTVVIYRPVPIEQQTEVATAENDFIEEIRPTDRAFVELNISAPRTTALGFKKISPTVVMEGIDLERRGVMNIADALYEAPFINATVSEENTTFSEFAAGANMVDLRNLGVSRTLVVVNGRRHIPSNGGNADLMAVDMNMLPTGLVERVEVLTTGASVLYGADALGGLVNVSLREDYEGLEISSVGNLSEKGDNGRMNVSASFGKRFGNGKGHYMAFVNFHSYAGLKARKRFLTADPAGHALGGVPNGSDDSVLTRGFGGSSTGPAGSVWAYARQDGEPAIFEDFLRLNLGVDGETIDEFTATPDQLYNFAFDSDLTVPISTYIYSGNFRYEIADGHEMFFEHTIGRSAVTRELAPTPLIGSTGLGIFVPIDNPFIPERLSEEVRAEVGDELVGLYLRRRVVEIGNRRNEIKRDLLRLAAGVEGNIWNDWSYSLYYQYGSSANSTEGHNSIDLKRVEASLSPDLCEARASEGCTITDYFGSNSILPAQADYLRATYKSSTSNNQHVLSGEFRGNIAQLPAGAFSMIAGAQYRRESSKSVPDELVQEGRVGGIQTFLPEKGGFDVFEGYLAVSAPILEDSLLGRRLTLDAGVRYSHFSTSKGAVSWQVGVDYQPTDRLSFRASYQEANRAPNVAELYFPSALQQYFYEDPCTDPASDIVAANCVSSHALGGITDDFRQESSVVSGIFTGAASLTEETAYTQNIGFTYEPELPERFGSLQFSFDWFSIEMENVIQQQAFIDVLTDCYNSPGFSSVFCGNNPANDRPFFERHPVTKQLQSINLSNWNDGTYNVKGFDAEINYSQRMANLGMNDDDAMLRIRLLHSYNLRYQLSENLGGFSSQFRGAVRQPKHRMLLSIGFENGPFHLNWLTSYRGEGRVDRFRSANLDGNQAGSFMYHNLSMHIEVADGFVIQAGVENLFNAQAPFLAFSTFNTFPEYYDVVGRRFFIGNKMRF